MCRATGNVKLADFGASKRLEGVSGAAEKMMIRGTPYYMARGAPSTRQAVLGSERSGRGDDPHLSLCEGVTCPALRRSRGRHGRRAYTQAPEVVRNHGDVGYEADVWSFGCTVLEMCTGQPPWKERRFESVHALMFHLASPAIAPAAPKPVSRLL